MGAQKGAETARCLEEMMDLKTVQSLVSCSVLPKDSKKVLSMAVQMDPEKAM